MRLTSALPLSLAVAVAACDRAPTGLDLRPTFKVAGTTVVTTLAEWEDAILSARRGATIAIEGTIEIPWNLAEVRLVQAPKVTITAASPGSGLRGVGEAWCLVCLGANADRATLTGLTLDGAVVAPFASFPEAPTASGDRPGPRGVTFQGNHVVCDFRNGCAIHIFFASPRDPLVADNVLMGQPSFSAIQKQASNHGRGRGEGQLD